MCCLYTSWRLKRIQRKIMVSEEKRAFQLRSPAYPGAITNARPTSKKVEKYSSSGSFAWCLSANRSHNVITWPVSSIQRGPYHFSAHNQQQILFFFFYPCHSRLFPSKKYKNDPSLWYSFHHSSHHLHRELDRSALTATCNLNNLLGSFDNSGRNYVCRRSRRDRWFSLPFYSSFTKSQAIV